MSRYINHLHDTSRILLKIKKAEATPTDWCRFVSSIESSLDASRLIFQYLKDSEK